MNFEYREMNHDDLKKCTRLFQEAFLKEPWKETWTYEKAYQRLEGIMDSKSSIGFVITDNHHMIGMLCGRIMPYLDDYELWVEEVCISDSYQGQGLGSQLLNYTKQELINKNVNRMVLNTTRGYLSDVFYLKNGFQEKDMIVCMSCEF